MNANQNLQNFIDDFDAQSQSINRKSTISNPGGKTIKEIHEHAANNATKPASVIRRTRKSL